MSKITCKELSQEITIPKQILQQKREQYKSTLTRAGTQFSLGLLLFANTGKTNMVHLFI